MQNADFHSDETRPPRTLRFPTLVPDQSTYLPMVGVEAETRVLPTVGVEAETRVLSFVIVYFYV